VRLEPLSPNEVRAACNFLVNRSRLERDVETFIGGRVDTLRRVAEPSDPYGWRIARREIHLDQTVLLAKNISFFL
jgi:3-phenylpropionate/cinnamic acid dioxygenase small subunit